tara:strand:+ start:5269 stop:6315 length:1047 start_codon:yes stop_codon:yes gene_type:complete
MNDTQLQKCLYTILQGRLRLLRSGLVVYIDEPSRELFHESFEIYDQAYEKAYLNGVYVDDEVKLILLEQDIWSPLNDRKVEQLKKDLENEKVSAFDNHYKGRELNFIKRRIRFMEEEMGDMFAAKTSMDHLTCNGVAEHARWHWLISKTTFNPDGSPYEWDKYSVGSVMTAYKSESVGHEILRMLARKDPWRSMWLMGKKITDVFGKAAVDLTKDQLALCSVSSMYDNVYENPECPSDKVIEDDDCLDGWFIVQRRKHKADKKSAEADQMIKNPKIRDAGEVFLVAKDKEDAENIYSMNNPLTRSTVKRRSDLIKDRGRVKDTDFADVQQGLQLQQNKQFVDKMRGGR